MKMYKEQIELESHGGRPTYFDITPQLKKIIQESGIKDGICAVSSPHTTCAVFFEEFVHDYTEEGDEFLQVDLNNGLNKIFPRHETAEQYLYPGEEHYREVESWPNAETYLPGGDRTQLFNCDAHLKATIIGSSEVFDVENGNLVVGVTGYAYFVDFDCSRPRPRKCKVCIIGE